MPTHLASRSCFNAASTAPTTLAWKRDRALRLLAIGLFSLAYSALAGAGQIDIIGPPGSSSFGTSVTVLPNGNIVVTDPAGSVSNQGAVYLYSPTGELISTLTGSAANDSVGTDGIKVLSNGNYVIVSPQWNNGAVADAGAVTWGNAVTGVSGVVSSSNSLVGTTSNDQVGSSGVNVLSNGNYVVVSRLWDNGAIANAGAATWGNGSTGTSGAVSESNSLVGTTANDQVGSSGGISAVTALSNGNYVVGSRNWRNGAATLAGAATWGNGSTGISGAVSASNSLVGTRAEDSVGSGGITALNNGNYVVASPTWDNGAIANVGAATWGNGSTGTSGAISASNSLVGSSTRDLVGLFGITSLSNGNYVVASSEWNNGAVANAGAATWGSGSTGTSGVVSAANSLVGTTANDQVGFSTNSITALSNGNYVVRSAFWDNGAVVDAGAATWGNGSTGTSGTVSAANSLIGASASDEVGRTSVTALSNGNYVVASRDWDNGAIMNAGAATWGNGGTGTNGPVLASNSLVGTTANDQVGSSGGISAVTALTNGNYVVASSSWHDGAIAGVGAATWRDGSMATSGVISASNSLVGTNAGDQVGRDGVISLTNGNYVVSSSVWANGAATRAGAATWGNGSTGTSGGVSAANSLVGFTTNDEVGSSGVTPLSGGSYAVSSRFWDNGAIVDAGAITLANGDGIFAGSIRTANSVLGTVATGGSTMVFGYDSARNQLIVGRPASNIVTLFDDRVFQNGFE